MSLNYLRHVELFLHICLRIYSLEPLNTKAPPGNAADDATTTPKEGRLFQISRYCMGGVEAWSLVCGALLAGTIGRVASDRPAEQGGRAPGD